MKKLWSFLLPLGYLAVLIGCGGLTGPDCEDIIAVVLLESSFPAAYEEPQDEFSFIDASITKDILELTVSYSGGCEAHEFQLYASRGIAKSYPPIGYLVLTHNAQHDECTDEITATLCFDLSPYREHLQSGLVETGPIFLNLRDYDGESLVYEY